jgi:hypothetical protein
MEVGEASPVPILEIRANHEKVTENPLRPADLLFVSASEESFILPQ